MQVKIFQRVLRCLSVTGPLIGPAQPFGLAEGFDYSVKNGEDRDMPRPERILLQAAAEIIRCLRQASFSRRVKSRQTIEKFVLARQHKYAENLAKT